MTSLNSLVFSVGAILFLVGYALGMYDGPSLPINIGMIVLFSFGHIILALAWMGGSGLFQKVFAKAITHLFPAHAAQLHTAQADLALMVRDHLETQGTTPRWDGGLTFSPQGPGTALHCTIHLHIHGAPIPFIDLEKPLAQAMNEALARPAKGRSALARHAWNRWVLHAGAWSSIQRRYTAHQHLHARKRAAAIS